MTMCAKYDFQVFEVTLAEYGRCDNLSGPKITRERERKKIYSSYEIQFDTLKKKKVLR